MGELFTTIFINPLINVLVAFYQLLTYVHTPYALGFAIIALTIFIRLLLVPLSAAQIRSTHKMQKISPHLASVRDKHKDDKRRQQEEMMKIYKEHNINPVSGCLPVLVQIPILWSLYTVLTQIVGANSDKAIQSINNVLYTPVLRLTHVWNTEFFGISLSAHPSQLVQSMPLILLVPFLTALFQFILSKMMVPEDAPVKTVGSKDDFQTAFQTQSLYIFPLIVGFFSFSLPFGLSLYWNTFTFFGILQQYILVGPGSLKPMVAKALSYGRK